MEAGTGRQTQTDRMTNTEERQQPRQGLQYNAQEVVTQKYILYIDKLYSIVYMHMDI